MNPELKADFEFDVNVGVFQLQVRYVDGSWKDAAALMPRAVAEALGRDLVADPTSGIVDFLVFEREDTEDQ